jgi:hypothetical protein
MQRTIWPMASVLVTLMLLSGVAWAANKYCHSGTTCRGTHGGDHIYGTLDSDSISGLRGMTRYTRKLDPTAYAEVEARTGSTELTARIL